ncbi:hypothetical protein L1987_42433 [Smallanthus sonchifolius]|uniref:Uncharacterized protein n=1 Tax=Smallanthus sonchifolius TaxID=185202 RepID=A0ACB9GIB2_9ASTR|nr:hypothetical protein L1987_42433 [Smallanthus sonchifolius]
MNQRFVSPRKLKACYICHDLYHLAYDCPYNPMNCNYKIPVNKRDGKEKMKNSNEFSKKSNSFQSHPKPIFQNSKPVFLKPTLVWAKRQNAKNVTSDDLFNSEKDLGLYLMVLDFVEEDDFRVEISNSILDHITNEHVHIASEVSEGTSQSVDVSSADSHDTEPISPISSGTSDLPKLIANAIHCSSLFLNYTGAIPISKCSFNTTEINGKSERCDNIIPCHFMSLDRSTFSGPETPLFPEMMGFGRNTLFGSFESGAESSSSGSSSSAGDTDHIDDGKNGKGENIHANVEFEHEELHTTQDSPPRQDKNETLQRVFTELTSLVSTLSTTVQSQYKEILKLKRENKRLKLSKSSSKPRKFKRLMRGPPPKPSYKNFVVSTSTSSEDVERQGEKISNEEIFGGNDSDEEIFDGDNAGPSSLADDVVGGADIAGPSSPIGENILSSRGSPIKSKQIMTEAESMHTLKTKLSKEMEEEQSRKAIAELLRQEVLEAKAHVDADIAKAASESLSSILSKKLEEEKKSISERINIPRNNARVYLRRNKDKYKRLYEFEHVDDLTDIDLERMVYLFEHGLKLEEIFALSLNKLEDANNHKCKQLKNTRIETLKKLVDDMKSEKDKEKKIILKKEIAKGKEAQKDEIMNKEKEKSKEVVTDLIIKVYKEIYSSYAVDAPIKRKMTKFRYNVHDVVARKTIRSKAPTTVLPQYNEEYTKNSVSLQPFTRAYVDDMAKLVVEGRDNMEPLRMYELSQIRTLTNEGIFALAAMEIAYKNKDEFYARDFANLLTKVSMDMRGIDYDNSQTFVLDHQLRGRL